jgi:CheY-like chemotaxis protein
MSERMGAEIASLESAPETGETWPMAMPDEAGKISDRPGMEPSASPEARSRQKLKLLLAEDNDTDVLLVKEAVRLYSLPMEIQVVDDGQKALDVLAEKQQNTTAAGPDIILMDLNLPRRSGLEVLQRIREAGMCANSTIIIFTSSDSEKDRAAVAALGITRYFRKPSRYEQFLQIGAVLKDVCAELKTRGGAP